MSGCLQVRVKILLQQRAGSGDGEFVNDEEYPMSILIAVVLPAPFGPIIPKHSPRLTPIVNPRTEFGVRVRMRVRRLAYTTTTRQTDREREREREREKERETSMLCRRARVRLAEIEHMHGIIVHFRARITLKSSHTHFFFQHVRGLLACSEVCVHVC